MGRLTGIIGVGAASVVVALGAAPAFAQTPTLRISHAAARVVIQPETRADIAVSVSVSRGASRLPPLSVRRDGGAVVVDGGLDTRSMTCDGGYSVAHLFGGIDHVRDTRRVKLAGVGWVNVSDLPVITVHTPRAVAVSTDGAVWGQAGPSEAMSLDAGGCGDWRIDPVRGKLKVDISGSGDVQAVTAGAAELRLAGSGDVALRGVTGPAEIKIMGSGDLRLGALAGALDARLLGSGDLIADRIDGPIKADLAGSSTMKIGGGHVQSLAVAVSGSGDFVFDGVASAVSASVTGSGDIHVAHADGPVGKSVAGSGSISIGR